MWCNVVSPSVGPFSLARPIVLGSLGVMLVVYVVVSTVPINSEIRRSTWILIHHVEHFDKTLRPVFIKPFPYARSVRFHDICFSNCFCKNSFVLPTAHFRQVPHPYMHSSQISVSHSMQ